MKKQISLLAILLLGLVTTAWATGDFTVKVRVGSADANPSLVFGQGADVVAETAEKPFPPTSSMFGVKDIYLVNPANLDKDTAGVVDELARLGTDLRETSDDNHWMIVTNSDAKLYFDVESNETVTLKIFASDADGAEVLGDSYSVKAGVDYTIFAADASEDAQKPAKRAVVPTEIKVYLAKSETPESEIYEGSEDTGLSFETEDGANLVLRVTTTDKPVYLATGIDEYTGGLLYVSFKDGTVADTSQMKTGWCVNICTEEGLKASPLSFDLVEENVLRVYNKTTPSTEGAIASKIFTGAVVLSGITYQSGYEDITLTGYVNDTKAFAGEFKILSDGTIDFDGDETVDINDAMYLLNFQEAGCPGEDDPFFTIDTLRTSTEVTDETRLNTALETLRGMDTALDFDEDGTVDINDAMYLLNFQEAGCPGEDDPFFTIDTLRTSTEVTDETRLNTALANLRNYAPVSGN